MTQAEYEAEMCFRLCKSIFSTLAAMLTDCCVGKIDHIITKSISQFSRNTVTLLDTVRELKGLGISVYFEEQSIDTATG